MPKSISASGLADVLDTANRNPALTGVWSRMQEEVARWAAAYPQALEGKYRLYRAAYNDLRNNSSNEAAQRAMVAANKTVADTLRRLNNATIEVCDSKVVGSIDPCNTTIAQNGTCPNAANHRR